MKFVLDASALLSGMEFSGEHEYYITPSIENEVRKGFVGRKLEYLKSCGLKVISPKKKYIEEIKNKAMETKDIINLSKADIEILALAKQLMVTLITDDYSIQNLASFLKIKYMKASQEGIKEEIIWSYRCSSCRKFYDVGYSECQICGGKIKRIRIK
ncbi:MAG: DNA-binding protein [Candidatus Thermoplasmatota archaeon]